AEFLFIDSDLLGAAIQPGTGHPTTGPSPAEWRAWVAALPDEEKTNLLCRLPAEDARLVDLELQRRFQEQRPRHTRGSAAEDRSSESGRRTVSQLLQAAEHHGEIRQRKEAQKQAAARKKHLDQLARRESDLWREIDQHLATSKASEHAQAVT